SADCGGTLALAVGAACSLSLHAVGVTERRFSRSIRKPGRASRRLHTGCRSGRLRASPELIPEEGSPPGFLASLVPSLDRRFAGPVAIGAIVVGVQRCASLALSENGDRG